MGGISRLSKNIGNAPSTQKTLQGATWSLKESCSYTWCTKSTRLNKRPLIKKRGYCLAMSRDPLSASSHLTVCQFRETGFQKNAVRHSCWRERKSRLLRGT